MRGENNYDDTAYHWGHVEAATRSHYVFNKEVTPVLRKSRVAILIALAGLCACGKSSTAPASNGGGGGGGGGSGGSTTTATYIGTVASAVATGSFAATFTTPASSKVASERSVEVGPSGHRIRLRSGPGASITITLLNGQTLTLTGSLSGSSFTLNDSNGDSCSGTLANVLAATCTFAIDPGASIGLIGALQIEGATAGLTTYCGLVHIPGVVSPYASMLLGVSGSQSFVATIGIPNNIPIFYAGSVTGSSFRDTSVTPHFTDFYSGTLSATTASGFDSVTTATLGDFSATTPCTLTAASISATSATFTASAGSAPAPVKLIVSPNTLGPMTAVVPSGATWLKASTAYDTLILAPASQPTSGTFNTAVTLYPQFASSPLTVNVSYTVTGGTGGGGSTGLWLGNSDGQLLEFTALTGPTILPSISTGTGGATGVGYLAADQQGNLWMSSAFRGTVDKLPPSNFSSGSPSLDIQIPRAPSGPSPQPVGIAFDHNGTLWVADSANSGWFYSYTQAQLSMATPTANPFTLTGVVTGPTSLGHLKLAAVAFDANGNLWLSDEASSLVFEVLAGQLNGSNVDLQAFGFIAVGGNGGSQPQSMAFDAQGNLWVSFLGFSAGGAVYEYAKSDLNNIQHDQSPSPLAEVQINGVADSITSIAFDQAGNLWLVESAKANVTTALAMVPKASIAAAGTYQVTPTVTYAATTNAQLPTSIAFGPPPSNLPMYSVPGRGPTPPNASPLASTRTMVRRRP